MNDNSKGEGRIVDVVRKMSPIMTSENNSELSKRINELSSEFLAKNAELYKRLETR